MRAFARMRMCECVVVCGSVELQEEDTSQSIQVVLHGDNEKITESVNSEGQFCLSVQPGSYQLSVQKSSIPFEPSSMEVSVSEASVFNLQFKKKRLNIEGSLSLLANNPIELFEVALKHQNKVLETIKVNVKENASFVFSNYPPSTYEIEIQDEKCCWKSKTLKVESHGPLVFT